MATTLTLTNGTTTIQLNNGAPWSLESDGIGFVWRPAINPWLINDLAGGGDWGPVDEEITIIGNAATQTSLRQSLQTLITIAQRIGSAYDGDVPEALLWRLQWVPEGSAVTYESVLLNGAIDVIEHPVTATGGALTRITLRATRRGRWLEPSPTTSSGTANRRTGLIGSGILTTPTAFTGATGEHPGYLELGKPDAGNVSIPVPASGYLLIAAEADADNRTSLQHLPWGASPGAPWSDIASETYNYRASPVRYTPAGTSWSDGPNVLIDPSFRTRIVDVYVIARNNSATTSFSVRVQAFVGQLDGVYSDTVVSAPSASPTPTLLYLGRIILPELRPYVVSFGSATFTVQVQASAASGSIDFDDVVIVNPDAAGTSILRVIEPSLRVILKDVSNQLWGVWEHEDVRNKRIAAAGLYNTLGVVAAEYTSLRPHVSWSYYGRASLLLPTAPSLLLYGAGSLSTGWSRLTGNIITYRLMRRISYVTPE